MAENSTPLSYAQLLDELRTACVEKRTGTMMIATQDNQLARIVFQDGDLISIVYRLKNGREAIPLLKEIKQARVKFSQGTVTGSAGNLPATAETMRMLSGDKAVAGASAPVAGSLGTDQIPKALKIIEAELVDFLGPLANIVWTEHVERLGKPVGANKLHSLVDGLAKEIGDPTKMQRFKEQVWRKVGTLRNAPR